MKTNPNQFIEKLDQNLENLAQTIKSEEDRKQFLKEMDGFKDIFSNFVEGRTKPIVWEKIQNLNSLPHYDKIQKTNFEEMKDIASKLAVVKLNGGLGTTM